MCRHDLHLACLNHVFCHTRDLDPLNDDLECIEILREVMQNALIPNQYWALIKALHHYQELDSSIQILDALRRMEELHYSKEYYPSDFTAVLKRFKKVLNEHGVDIPYERLLTKVKQHFTIAHLTDEGDNHLSKRCHQIAVIFHRSTQKTVSKRDVSDLPKFLVEATKSFLSLDKYFYHHFCE